MEITALVLAILFLLVVSTGKVLKNLKSVKVPKWAQRLRSSDPWRIGGTELFAHARIVKWLLLAILKLGLIILSFFSALLQIAIDAASTMIPKAIKL